MTEESNKTLEVIASVLMGSETEEERAQFINWISESEDNKYLFEEYRIIWNKFNTQSRTQKFDPYKAWAGVSVKQQNTKTIGILPTIFRYVAAVAAIFIISFGINYLYKSDENVGSINPEFSYSTTVGSRSDVSLPDGSTVKLNSKSQLLFSDNQNYRLAKLRGEAFFVVKKSTKPFVVELSEINIKVYGTEFNVHAYDDDDFITATLKEGKISVTKKDTSKEYFMKPHQQVIFSRKDKTLRILDVNVNGSTAWIDKKLVVRNEKLSLVIKKLERMYDVTIKFKHQEIANYHFTGVVENKTIDEVLESICQISGCRYIKKGKIYTVIK